MIEGNFDSSLPDPSLLTGGDRRVSPQTEVEIKAELTARDLPDLIDQFLAAKTVDERASLQEEITRLAKSAHDIQASNEP